MVGSPAVAFNDDGPPSIPAARLDWTGVHLHPLLVWVHAGSAHAVVDHAVAFHLSAGQGALLTVGGYRHRGIVTEPGSVAFPLWLEPGGGLPTEPTRFEVPDGWRDWLIQYFNLQVTPFSGRGYSQDTITGLFRHPGAQAAPPRHTKEALSPLTLGPPPMPRTGAARRVAEELIRDPALDFTIQEWATQVLSSPRTLLRQFLTDTALTFMQWRQRCRLHAAVELLVAGYEIAQVAARVGFISRGGFDDAFKRQFGSTPYRFSRELSARLADDRDNGRAAAARQADNLARLIRGGDVSAAAPHMLPAARTPSHTNDTHVLSWMYRGSGYLDIRGRRYERRRGVATWIPAGVEHVTGLHQDSISLPLGEASTADLQLTRPLQARFSPAWDDYLMFCSISARSLLRPDGYDPRHVLDLFADQVATQRALSVPMPTNPHARELAMTYLRRIGTSRLDVPADIQRIFVAETGMTFARWCYAARMRIARDLLGGGAKPSAVARRVGYTHLPTFSTAFSRFHGLSPREYQEQHLTKD
ncbi:AraC family transcriptional regulator [Tessaracoccus caeni]|uniref:AraC family transcriptional regulator n=1 Tax=Tessaracoccus caeni TaxID=3031239 RepID=UPI0023DC679A|nr:AraC family transcriptional regulator [Tessaracoccus caeni]MDF1487106.1 AraC family transcriptional regulator [Tessaracoccus caeni]